jgi:hypothetical protein
LCSLAIRKGICVGKLQLEITNERQAEEALQESEKQPYREEKRMEISEFADDVALKLTLEFRHP